MTPRHRMRARGMRVEKVINPAPPRSDDPPLFPWQVCDPGLPGMAAYTLESAAVRCSDTLSLLVSPEVAEFCRSKSEKYGPGLSGALFGVGVWFWLDAVAISPIKVPFSQARRGSVRGGACKPLEGLAAGVRPDPPHRLHSPTSLQYLPGLVAVLALLMITAVRR